MASASQPSVLDTIKQALDTAETYYKVKGAKAALDLTQWQQDPESDYSRSRQAAKSDLVDYLSRAGVMGQGPAQDINARMPKLSGADLDKFKETDDQLRILLSPGRQGGNQLYNAQNQMHSKIVDNINSDPQMQKYLTNFNLLDNALTHIAEAKITTPQGVHEFQQAVRSATGIQGGVGAERLKTYLGTLGWNVNEFLGYVTGKPANIRKTDPIITHFVDLARLEQKNSQQQFQKRVTALTKGNDWVYQGRPDLMKSLMSGVRAARDQYQTSVQDPTESNGLSNTGDITSNPEFKNFMIQNNISPAEFNAYMNQYNLNAPTAFEIMKRNALKGKNGVK